jgi:hypothetical protein
MTLAHGDVVEFDGAVDDLFLEGGQQAHAAGCGGDELEFFGRVDGAFAGERRAEETEDDGGREIHEADGRARHADEDVHGSGDGEGDALGTLEGERLGDEFAEEDFKVGDGGEGDDDGDGVRVEDSVGRKDVSRRRRG